MILEQNLSIFKTTGIRLQTKYINKRNFLQQCGTSGKLLTGIETLDAYSSCLPGFH